jgi:hypothetical protein
MSLDAGGLAQMTYNQNAFNGGLGFPGSGFASRAKANNMKRLSVAPPSKISTIDENQPAALRTSRSHLLAGLRTAPKSPTFPISAPSSQLQFPQGAQNGGLTGSRFAGNNYAQRAMPKTATNANFPGNYQNQYNAMNHIYSPQEILAPPAIHIGEDGLDSPMDPNLYDELVRTNQYLAQQQMRLQQQLINVTAAAQQIQNMNLGPQQQVMSPGLGGFYNQQLQNGLQPIVEPVPHQPGLYSVYNPMTGQVNYFVDNSAHQQQQQQQQQTQQQKYSQHLAQEMSHSPPPPTPTFRAQISPPQENANPMNSWRSNTPPKSSPSPPREEANPLPPPSANAFRPSHRKNNLSLSQGVTTLNVSDGPKTGGLKSAGLPPTPMTGTFGPGQAREGEHPLRQPRGPPSLEELTAKPTTKFEGSKNFASRQRRRALNNLVRAGLERRKGSSDSVEGFTPSSEKDFTFSVTSSDGEDSVRSSSLSRKPSIGSMRAVANGAIGSERKRGSASLERKEGSRIGTPTAESMSSEDGLALGGKLVEVRVEGVRTRSPVY